MKCLFGKRTGSGSYQRITQNVDTHKTTTYGDYPPRTVYHNYTCTMNLPVSQLAGEGTHQFTFAAAVVKGSSILNTDSPIVENFNLDTPTVTEYKANSKSTELTVSADDTVTFVCNVEGNPRPSLSVKGQKWDGVVTLQDTPSGSYVKESSGTKKMSCKDTDVYTCMADNGVGGVMSKDISVFVECVPELPFTSFIQEFSPTNGNDLEVEIQIIGFPQPNSYSLKKVSNSNRRKRAVIRDEPREAHYNVTYIPDNPPKGVVVLTMMRLTEMDSGQYVLTIDNGIKDGLDYSFNVNITPENKNPSDVDDDKNGPIVIGLVIGFVAAVALTASFCLGFKVRTNRLVKERRLLQQQLQRQQQLQEQHQPQPQRPQQLQPQQPQLHPTHYEEIGFNEYDGYNILDAQEKANDYHYITSHDTRGPQTPMNRTREGSSTEQGGGGGYITTNKAIDHTYLEVIDSVAEGSSTERGEGSITTNKAIDHTYLEVIDSVAEASSTERGEGSITTNKAIDHTYLEVIDSVAEGSSTERGEGSITTNKAIDHTYLEVIDNVTEGSSTERGEGSITTNKAIDHTYLEVIDSVAEGSSTERGEGSITTNKAIDHTYLEVIDSVTEGSSTERGGVSITTNKAIDHTYLEVIDSVTEANESRSVYEIPDTAGVARQT